MRVASALLAFLLGSIATVNAARTEGRAQRPQYVVISFDGAHDNAQWARSRELARQTGAQFTYFLSCVYLLSPETKRAYDPPAIAGRRSNVGFGASKEDVAGRLGQIWAAHGEGHDIANHGCGHFDGGAWSKADWLKEFDAFSDILARAWTINGIAGEPEGWRDFSAAASLGFRAPYLAPGKGLAGALKQRGFLYDASTVSRDPAEPEEKGGIVDFALPLIPEGPSERRVIAMDYNLFVRHSGGFEKSDADGAFEERAYEAFKAAFDKQYEGKRIPLQLGFHFTLMNGGAYWAALERFAREACAMPDVKCVSYRDVVEDMRRASDRVHTGAGG